VKISLEGRLKNEKDKWEVACLQEYLKKQIIMKKKARDASGLYILLSFLSFLILSFIVYMLTLLLIPLAGLYFYVGLDFVTPLL
jgi:hypothetical protein